MKLTKEMVKSQKLQLWMIYDKKLGGVHKSDLIIIAGRPSMGKTALGTNIAFNCAIKYQEIKDDLDNIKIIDGGKGSIFLT